MKMLRRLLAPVIVLAALAAVAGPAAAVRFPPGLERRLSDDTVREAPAIRCAGPFVADASATIGNEPDPYHGELVWTRASATVSTPCGGPVSIWITVDGVPNGGSGHYDGFNGSWQYGSGSSLAYAPTIDYHEVCVHAAPGLGTYSGPSAPESTSCTWTWYGPY